MKRFVEEVMQREVVTVTPDTEVRELMRLLVKAQISGVPVVSEEGDIVGVVSNTDVVRVAAEASELPNETLTWEPLALPSEDFEEGSLASFFLAPESLSYQAEQGRSGMPEGVLDSYTVGDIMTPAVFTVRPQDTVETVAKFLLQGRIHRALVVEEGQLKGIVTTFDLLTALIEGPEE